MSTTKWQNIAGSKKFFIGHFMHGFKSAILAIFQFLQNGTFEPMHEICKKNLAKSILLKHYENGN
jgi:hypothetical protein